MTIDSELKVILIGDSTVGKTTFVHTFTKNKYDDKSCATIGAEFRGLNYKYDDKEFKLNIWDTAGQEQFRSITSMFYRDIDAVLVLFDVTNRNSFDHVLGWLEDVNDHCTDHTVVILIGTKIDLVNQRVVSSGDIERLVQDVPMTLPGIDKYIEISSLEKHNLDYVFESICSEYVVKNPDRPITIERFSIMTAAETEKSNLISYCNCS